MAIPSAFLYPHPLSLNRAAYLRGSLPGAMSRNLWFANSASLRKA
jgi:hypothetical protein